MEVLGQSIKGEELIYGIGDIIAAHNLLHYVKDVSSDTRVRMASAAVLGGLGYCFGPEVSERVKNFAGADMETHARKQLVYAATGTLLGALAGYSLTKRDTLPLKVQETVDQAVRDIKDPTRPGPLPTILSVGWLGYSLFRKHGTAEDRERHYWGFGGALLGYAYGPETIQSVRNMLIPKETHEQVLHMYGKSSVVVGAVTGGMLGWTNGQFIASILR